VDSGAQGSVFLVEPESPREGVFFFGGGGHNWAHPDFLAVYVLNVIGMGQERCGFWLLVYGSLFCLCRRHTCLLARLI